MGTKILAHSSMWHQLRAKARPEYSTLDICVQILHMYTRHQHMYMYKDMDPYEYTRTCTHTWIMYHVLGSNMLYHMRKSMKDSFGIATNYRCSLATSNRHLTTSSCCKTETTWIPPMVEINPLISTPYHHKLPLFLPLGTANGTTNMKFSTVCPKVSWAFLWVLT